jgi:hypothetical protein
MPAFHWTARPKKSVIEKQDAPMKLGRLVCYKENNESEFIDNLILAA